MKENFSWSRVPVRLMRTVALHSVVHGASARVSGLRVIPSMAFQGVLRTTFVGQLHISLSIQSQILLTKLSAHVIDGMLEKTDHCVSGKEDISQGMEGRRSNIIMSQQCLPIWFRAYVIIPVLAVLYVAIPSRWPFSPHVLTHSMPYFLLGASDWGVSNIYAFTKMAYWIGLLIGGIANAMCLYPSELNVKEGLTWRFRLNAWHFGAAFTLAIIATVLLHIHGHDGMDMCLLTGFLVIGALSIILLLSYGQRRSWSVTMRVCSVIVIGVVWGFVPVNIGRP